MQTLINELTSHIPEIVSALVALFLIYARASVLSRLADAGVEEAEAHNLTKPMRHERVVAGLKNMPWIVRPLTRTQADKAVAKARTRAKKAKRESDKVKP
jgi:hypothetical protein